VVSLDEVPPERLAGPADSAEARELLRGWLSQLPPRQAEVFVLALDGWSDLEIAQMLGIAYNTARAYRQEGRRRLKELAREAGFDAPAERGRG
jgi:RNA polymerase sigma-70 factor (ECF subfamily)